MTQDRDYDREFQDNRERRYAYDFDEVVRRYLMRTLAPWFRPGPALEIGCYEGDSTRALREHFDTLAVLEASSQLIETARARVPADVEFVHGTLEQAQFPGRFESIFLVHTLEHLDDAVGALARLRGWLTPGGRLYVVVPNAHAASRQIAVKMGLIEHTHAVTAGEHAHGHRRTYSLDTLEADARKAGLTIESRGGVMFKPFANFQFDRLIAERIIDPAYIEGCYALGMQYPDLTASVYLVCRA